MKQDRIYIVALVAVAILIWVWGVLAADAATSPIVGQPYPAPQPTVDISIYPPPVSVPRRLDSDPWPYPYASKIIECHNEQQTVKCPEVLGRMDFRGPIAKPDKQIEVGFSQPGGNLIYFSAQSAASQDVIFVLTAWNGEVMTETVHVINQGYPAAWHYYQIMPSEEFNGTVSVRAIPQYPVKLDYFEQEVPWNLLLLPYVSNHEKPFWLNTPTPVPSEVVYGWLTQVAGTETP